MKIGRFPHDRAHETYLRAYDAMESLWPLPSEQVDVDTSFGPTHVRRSGSGQGDALVLLSGLNGNSLSWHFAVEDLAVDREVVAVDTLGTAGRSVQTAPFEGRADLATWFGEVLDGLAIDRAHLLGESNGAWHGTLIALRAQHRLASLTVVEPNGFITRVRRRALAKFIALSARPTDAGWQKMSDWLTPGVTPTVAEIACAKAALRFRPGIGWARPLSDADLARLTIPTLAIFGAESVLSEPAASAGRLAEVVPGVEIVIVPGGGHAVHAQHPELVRPRILDFIERHDRTQSSPRLVVDDH